MSLSYASSDDEHCLGRWFYEAVTETIFLDSCTRNLLEDNVDFRLTLARTISMMNDELLMHRYKNHLEKLIELAEKSGPYP